MHLRAVGLATVLVSATLALSSPAGATCHDTTITCTCPTFTKADYCRLLRTDTLTVYGGVDAGSAGGSPTVWFAAESLKASPFEISLGHSPGVLYLADGRQVDSLVQQFIVNSTQQGSWTLDVSGAQGETVAVPIMASAGGHQEAHIGVLARASEPADGNAWTGLVLATLVGLAFGFAFGRRL